MFKKTIMPGFEIAIEDRDVTALRRLAEEIAKIAALPVQEQNRKIWRDVNDNKKDSIAVLVRNSEIPWHEMNVDGELVIKTGDPFSRSIEQDFRRTLYQWKHCRCDMVVDAVFRSGLVILDTGFGISSREQVIQQGEGNAIYSHRYEPVIKNEADVERINEPVVSHNEEMSEKLFEVRKDLFGGILDVRKRGIHFSYTALWDELVPLWGPENLLVDLIERPDLVRMAIVRYTDAWLSRLDQYEKLNLLDYEDGNYDVGSGGLGFVSDLPGEDFKPGRVRLKNQWGFSTAQIFGSVSPAMHEEFALQYERPLLDRFGLSYYGCCEPLHDKVHILRSIPNLRKISMSPWADIEKGVENTGGDYVLSVKPNPNVFAMGWDPVKVRQGLESVLKSTRGCAVEIIMKDISTVSGRPEHLHEWAAIAMEVADRYR